MRLNISSNLAEKTEKPVGSWLIWLVVVRLSIGYRFQSILCFLQAYMELIVVDSFRKRNLLESTG